MISSAANRATVILNYKIGDLVTLEAGPCTCGRSLPTLASIDGRADDLIATAHGSPLHPLSVLPVLQAVPGVIRIQLIQEELGRFRLNVVASFGCDWEDVRQRLESAFTSIFGSVALTIERLERIPLESSGKVKGVVSRCRA